jgi:uncharacterized UPF0146 family protein
MLHFSFSASLDDLLEGEEEKPLDPVYEKAERVYSCRPPQRLLSSSCKDSMKPFLLPMVFYLLGR